MLPPVRTNVPEPGPDEEEQAAAENPMAREIRATNLDRILIPPESALDEQAPVIYQLRPRKLVLQSDRRRIVPLRADPPRRSIWAWYAQGH